MRVACSIKCEIEHGKSHSAATPWPDFEPGVGSQESVAQNFPRCVHILLMRCRNMLLAWCCHVGLHWELERIIVLLLMLQCSNALWMMFTLASHPLSKYWTVMDMIYDLLPSIFIPHHPSSYIDIIPFPCHPQQHSDAGVLHK